MPLRATRPSRGASCSGKPRGSPPHLRKPTCASARARRAEARYCGQAEAVEKRADLQPLLVVRSPDARVQWRIVGDRIERSTDGGRTWDVEPAPALEAVTMGAAPSVDVCWVAGASGQVLRRTEDGHLGRRLTVPAPRHRPPRRQHVSRGCRRWSRRHNGEDGGRRANLDAVTDPRRDAARLNCKILLSLVLLSTAHTGAALEETEMRPFSHVAFAAVTLFVAAAPTTRTPPGATPPPAGIAVPTATLDDQVDLAVTVYNSNIGLVRDVRRVTLPAGVTDLRLLDIAATVNPATVHVRSLTEPSRLGVLEQNYQFDLLNPDRLLRKYVGRDIKLLRRYDENGTTREREVTARLLAYNEAPVWQIDDEIVTGLHADQLRFPEIPPNLHSRPTLVWRLDNSGATQHRLETSYLAGNMDWTADYVLTVGRDDARADLDGWVTVSNTSGTSYRQASLQLVAGELHRVPETHAKLEAADGARAERGSRRSRLRARDVLRVPPLHAGPPHIAGGERDEADRAPERHAAFPCASDSS